MTTIANLRDKTAVAAAKADGTYMRIDRRTRWGNPFVIGRDGDRESVIDQYRHWLSTQPQLLAALPELRGKTLFCHCHPLACHGDILAALAHGGAA